MFELLEPRKRWNHQSLLDWSSCSVCDILLCSLLTDEFIKNSTSVGGAQLKVWCCPQLFGTWSLLKICTTIHKSTYVQVQSPVFCLGFLIMNKMSCISLKAVLAACEVDMFWQAAPYVWWVTSIQPVLPNMCSLSYTSKPCNMQFETLLHCTVMLQQNVHMCLWLQGTQ